MYLFTYYLRIFVPISDKREVKQASALISPIQLKYALRIRLRHRPQSALQFENYVELTTCDFTIFRVLIMVFVHKHELS